MSIAALHWANQVQAPLSSREAFLLEKLAWHADEHHIAFPSMDTLAREVRCNRATVWRLLTRLEQFHHLIVKVEGGGNRGRSNRYRLLVDVPVRRPPLIPDDRRNPTDGADLLPAQIDLFGLKGTVITEIPDEGGVAPRDTLYPQGVASDATGGVLHHATPPLSIVKGGVASDATGGVASDATGVSRLARHDKSLKVNEKENARASALRPQDIRICGERHIDPATGEIIDCARYGKCRQVLPKDTIELGMAQIAAMRERLAKGKGCSLDGGGV